MGKRPQHSSQKPSKSHKHLTDTWFFEIATLAVGICAFIVIIVLLAHYDSRQQFQWHGITLNAVISVLATITRIGIVVPVAEGLAQWKWMQFSKGPKPLRDFDLLDDASRGSRGSLLLLWEKRSLTFTSIGAWVVILSAAIEPFFQQIISFEDTVSYRDNSNVNITYSILWDGGTWAPSNPSTAYPSENATGLYEHVAGYGSVSDLNLDFQGQAAVLFGLNTNAAVVNQQLKTTCPSGNCTWPAYLSLGVCSKCNAVTDQVRRGQKVDYPESWYFPDSGGATEGKDPPSLTTYSLSNGLSLSNEDPVPENSIQSNPLVMTVRGNVAPSETVSFKDATTLLWSAAILQVQDWASTVDGFGQWIDATAPNVEATECGLYLCVKEYNSQIVNGLLNESFRDVASTRDKDSWQVQFDSDGGIPNGYVYLDGVSPAVDALFTTTKFFQRTALSITVPSKPASTDLYAKNIRRVNATQKGIYTLSNYISQIFNDGAFTNATLPDSSQFNCTLNGTSIPCGHLNNVTGMVVIQDALTSQNSSLFDPPVMSILYNNRNNLSDIFSALAESITTTMRRPGLGTPTISGKLGTLQTLLHVRWPWITLPLVCMLVSTLFLLLSIYEAHVDLTPLWKSGGLAYLAHGLDRQTRERIQHKDLASGIEAAAEGVKVRLWRGEDGVLMLRGQGEEMEGKLDGEEDEHQHEHEYEHEHEETEPLSAGVHREV